ncbi:PREDICTED: uncharacterized protein LOC109206730 [Nicotiana attenuata]|uniref:uncharacterized protein LOC109206730 n=1 Tax=Nicotiana attenuata TaxID=49451 RepID=UPI000905C504|nr:PREDICTED: uncharacterized protein LOC109206730 [Nicotiana attenuata]
MKGHTKETCYKVVGYPKDNKFKKKYNSQATANFAAEDVPATTTGSTPMAPTFTPEQYQQNLQLLKDSGASNHMVSKLEALDNPTSLLKSNSVHFPNGDVAAITHSGSTSIFKNQQISDVLHDLYTGKVLEIGSDTNGLYILKDCICRRKLTTPTVHTTIMPTSMSVSQDSMKLEIWHQRLGRLPVETLKRIDMFKNLHITNSNSDRAMCHVCLLARQTRLPFPILRTNNGSEFVNSNKKQLVETLEIIHQTTCVYIPQQNGIVERRHRYILETARALRFQSGVRLRFWDEHLASPASDVVQENPPTPANDFALSDADSPLTPEAQFDIPAPQNVETLQSPSHVEVVQPIAVRKSQRTIGPPRWMQDYVTSSCAYPMSNYLSYDGLSPSYIKCLIAESVIVEPKYYSEATKDARWGDLFEEVYMHLPQGFGTKGSLEPRRGDALVVALVYVDDLLVIGNNQQLIQAARDSLQKKFKMKDLGELRFFLGIEFARSKAGILMNQCKYTLDLISNSGLGGEKPVSTPLEVNQKLTSVEFDEAPKTKDDEDTILADDEPYQRLVGKLLYLTMTRPHITYVVQNAPGLGLLMSSADSRSLVAYCDSDWAACRQSRKSVTGYIVKYGESLISWKSKKQSTVSRSSAEAEFRSMASIVAELSWLVGLFKELGINVELPIDLFCDSKAAIQIAADPIFHERTKLLTSIIILYGRSCSKVNISGLVKRVENDDLKNHGENGVAVPIVGVPPRNPENTPGPTPAEAASVMKLGAEICIFELLDWNSGFFGVMKNCSTRGIAQIHVVIYFELVNPFGIGGAAWSIEMCC